MRNQKIRFLLAPVSCVIPFHMHNQCEPDKWKSRTELSWAACSSHKFSTWIIPFEVGWIPTFGYDHQHSSSQSRGVLQKTSKKRFKITKPYVARSITIGIQTGIALFISISKTLLDRVVPIIKPFPFNHKNCLDTLILKSQNYKLLISVHSSTEEEASHSKFANRLQNFRICLVFLWHCGLE